MKSVIIGALAFVALTGCSKNIDNLEAVKQGVIKDIAKGVSVGSMDVNVASVSFRGKEADAVVTFAPKGGKPMMSMNYTMERKGDEWHIKARASGDIQKHAAQQAPAAGSAGAAPPINGTEPLPPGHPSMPGGGQTAAPPAGGGDSKLPPGHPPLGSQQ